MDITLRMLNFSGLRSPVRTLAVLFALITSMAFFSLVTANAQEAQPKEPEWLTRVIKSGASAEIVNRFSPKLVQWQDSIAKYAAGPKSRFWKSEEIEKAIESLESVRPQLREFVSQLTPKLKDAQAKLAKLGPPPKDGATESEQLASQRKSMSDEVAAYDGLIKRAEVLFVQAGQSIAAHNAARRRAFLRNLLRQSDGFTDGYFWQNLSGSIGPQISRAGELGSERFGRLATTWPAVAMTLALWLFTLWVSVKLSIEYFGPMVKPRLKPRSAHREQSGEPRFCGALFQFLYLRF